MQAPTPQINTQVAVVKELKTCDRCDKKYKGNAGLKNHQRFCKAKPKTVPTPPVVETPDRPIVEDDIQQSMPTATNNQNEIPLYTWGNYDNTHVVRSIEYIYEKIVYWRRNLFMLPFGKVGKTYIEQTNYLLNEWLHDSPIAGISIKMIMVMPQLLLQKPSQKSKAKDHSAHLKRRLELWTKGEFYQLLEEGTAIQQNLKSSSRPKTIAEVSKRFLKEMQRGNINGAIKILTNNMENGILPINETTLQLLRQKHPEAKEPPENALLTDKEKPVHPIKFEMIDAEMVRKAASRTKGGAGPSGLDANGWCRILTSNCYGTSSSDLCKTLALVIKRLCTEKVNSTSIEALLASRLIPLDKNPGLRPIGVGEILRRIAGKVVTAALRQEIISSVGCLQTCAGLEAGCESTIHAMRTKFDQEESEAVLLVDASNAFNAINRKAFLHNVGIVCPPLAVFVRNCYAENLRLFVIGGVELSSREGTTQGDPVAMAIYAVAIIPLILMLVEASVAQNHATISAGFADDLTAAGKIDELLFWWKKLCSLGPDFGYYPEATKSWLITKQRFETVARNTFRDSKVNITIEGKRHLGATIGSEGYKKSFVRDKVKELIDQLKVLSKIAHIEPQAAYTCFTAGFKHKLTYLMRTIPNIVDELAEFDFVLDNEFITAITDGIHCSPIERQLISLPTKMGGLAIPIYTELSDEEFENSIKVTQSLSNAILQRKDSLNDYNQSRSVKREIRSEKSKRHEAKRKTIIERLPIHQRRAVEISSEKGASIWLTTIPLIEEGYNIPKNVFWDLIRLRYGWNLKRLPAKCECGETFTIEHSLTCKKGGFVSLRHNNLRNLTANLLSTTCKDVCVEPALSPLTGEEFNERSAILSDDARLDIKARGFWQAGQLAFFDIRVFNPLAKRYANQGLKKCFEINEKEKKKSYGERILQIEHGSFTPLVFSATGGMGRETTKFYSRLAETLGEKKNISYSLMVTWLRRKISFSLISAVAMCIRGSRSCGSQKELLESLDNPVVSETIANF